ncbi:MAG: isochorismatase family protein [Myxococcota bacterium]|nr:isochorismatase family protein [Myxococcota bacterium]
MTLSVLITECLQRDFIGPVGAHDPLPNKLHIGRQESLRLMGRDPQLGPVAQVMDWARAQPEDRLAILHVRDWHDDGDPRQRDHLQMFGAHCVGGTPGSALVLGLDQGTAERPNEHVIDSGTLNDFEDSELPGQLERILALAGDQPVRVGVVGVWTEAKVSFLLYDLKTRAHVNELATCSALTASASRAQHFNALDQLRKVLGVRVCDSVGEFAEWLNPEGPAPTLRRGRESYRPQLRVDGQQGTIDRADRDLLSFLYRDSSAVELDTLAGGYSGALVYQAASVDAVGHAHAPSVAKLGPREMIAAERVAFERVEAILGNRAPAIRGYVDLGERAGIKYSYAAMGRGGVRTFQSLFQGGLEQERVDGILREVFEEILEPFYAAAHYERLPLAAYYTFSPEHVASVARNVARVHGPGGDADELRLPDGRMIPNVTRFYAEQAPALLRNSGEYHYVSYVHGDLNGANILMDGRDNLWIIDFFHTARGHVLQDLLKLENDLLYIYTPVESEADLIEALRISEN